MNGFHKAEVKVDDENDLVKLATTLNLINLRRKQLQSNEQILSAKKVYFTAEASVQKTEQMTYSLETRLLPFLANRMFRTN